MEIILYGLVFLAVVAGSLLFWARASWTASLVETLQSLVGRLIDIFAASRRLFCYYLTFGRASESSGGHYTALPTTFTSDAEAGLSSSTFDLTGNVEASDSRAGLDDISKSAILKIMKKRRLPFDEARRVYMEQRFRDNDISADGRPRDPKFVSFS